MNIIEATKKALDENKAITNPEDKKYGIAYLPTNSGPLGVVIISNKKGAKLGRYWNPLGSDLLREDWELY